MPRRDDGYSAALVLRAGVALAAATFFGVAAGFASALPEAVLRPAARRGFGAATVSASPSAFWFQFLIYLDFQYL